MKDEPSVQNLCLHTHNLFCDGTEDINTLINSAVSQGVKQIGISSHAPLKIPIKWSMEYNQLENYQSEIVDLKAAYRTEIEVFTSLEIDYIPNKTYSFDFFRKKLQLDYTIGSIHLVINHRNGQLWFIDGPKEQCIHNMNAVFEGDVKLAVKSFYAQSREMIRSQKPDIIGHLDKVIMNTRHLFDPSERWYQEEVHKTLEEIRAHHVIVEVNTRGVYKRKWKETFPSEIILQKCFDMRIPILISSDAHHAKELLLGYSDARKLLKQIGFRYQQGRINSKWGNIPI